MCYEEIRAARLQHPFRPFKLRMKTGEEHLIEEPTTLAISRNVLFFIASRTGALVHSTPAEVDSLTYVDDASKRSA